MISERGYSQADVITTVFLVVVGGAMLIGLAPQPHTPAPLTFSNLHVISQAASEYQADHANRLPLRVSYSRGASAAPGVVFEGWCNWSFGGKNNNAFWSGRPFDVEAADRPLNPYVIPDEYFYAPAPPSRLPGSHPARTQAHAPMFRDPSDRYSFQRNWPQPTTTISGYDDIGTSYLSNVAWWDQLPQSMPFEQRYNEGVRRIAAGEGAHPSRFVWLSDQYGDILSTHTSPRYRITNGIGDVNYAPILFLDGHSIYTHIRPTVRTTSLYTFRFEP